MLMFSIDLSKAKFMKSVIEQRCDSACLQHEIADSTGQQNGNSLAETSTTFYSETELHQADD
jgi:hypothetical protein